MGCGIIPQARVDLWLAMLFVACAELRVQTRPLYNATACTYWDFHMVNVTLLTAIMLSPVLLFARFDRSILYTDTGPC